LYERRRKIVSGEHEPADDECTLPTELNASGDSADLKLDKERGIYSALLALSKRSADLHGGIPEFWLTVFKRVGLISKMIEPHDEPVLKSLVDVELDLSDRKPYNFSIKFHFAPNEFFTNTTLVKNYEFKIEVDKNDPFVFEAPETERSRGCLVRWRPGRNVTTVDGQPETEDGSNKRASFFNFFETLDVDARTMTGEQEAELVIDYELGFTFKEKCVPRAVLYYMDEICDDSDEDDESDDEAEIEE
jgi:hypothetical protein